MMVTIFWDVVPCLVDVNSIFRSACYLHLQGYEGSSGLITLKMEAADTLLNFYQTWHNIPKGSHLQASSGIQDGQNTL
jgi:hypothetical protein